MGPSHGSAERPWLWKANRAGPLEAFEVGEPGRHGGHGGGDLTRVGITGGEHPLREAVGGEQERDRRPLVGRERLQPGQHRTGQRLHQFRVRGPRPDPPHGEVGAGPAAALVGSPMYLPTVISESCGAMQMATTSEGGPAATSSTHTSAIRGRQCRMPTATLTPGRAASSFACTDRMMSSTGDLPPVARYRSRISSTSSGAVGRPPRTSSRYASTLSSESGPPMAMSMTWTGRGPVIARSCRMIWTEPAHGSPLDPSFGGLPGLERLRMLMTGEVSGTPLNRLTGIGLTQVGPGHVTGTMPATMWLQTDDSLDVTCFAQEVMTGTVLTTAPAGHEVIPATFAIAHLRPAGIDSGSFIARGRALHSGPRFTLAEILIEDARGRGVAHATGSLVVRPIEPAPRHTSPRRARRRPSTPLPILTCGSSTPAANSTPSSSTSTSRSQSCSAWPWARYPRGFSSCSA